MYLSFHWPQIVIALWLLYAFVSAMRTIPHDATRGVSFVCVGVDLSIVGFLAFTLYCGGFWTQP